MLQPFQRLVSSQQEDNSNQVFCSDPPATADEEITKEQEDQVQQINSAKPTGKVLKKLVRPRQARRHSDARVRPISRKVLSHNEQRARLIKDWKR